jgi:hypothetical protein
MLTTAVQRCLAAVTAIAALSLVARAAEPADAIITFMIEVARDGCISAGTDPDGLRRFADQRKWVRAAPGMSDKFDGTPYRFLNGWTADVGGQPVAIIQTEDTRDGSRSCSLTASLRLESQHANLMASWHAVISPERHSDILKPEKHSHIDAIRGENSAHLVSTLSFDRVAGMSTLLVTVLPNEKSAKPAGEGPRQWRTS